MKLCLVLELGNLLVNIFPFSAGEYHCPVLNKVFTEFTHIVAVKTTGNVFCFEVCSLPYYNLHGLFFQFCVYGT